LFVGVVAEAEAGVDERELCFDFVPVVVDLSDFGESVVEFVV